jgi:hypothetical protein
MVFAQMQLGDAGDDAGDLVIVEWRPATDPVPAEQQLEDHLGIDPVPQ